MICLNIWRNICRIVLYVYTYIYVCLIRAVSGSLSLLTTNRVRVTRLETIATERRTRVASRVSPRRSHFEIFPETEKNNARNDVRLGAPDYPSHTWPVHLAATKLSNHPAASSGCIIIANKQRGLRCYSAFVSPLHTDITVTSFVRDPPCLFLCSLWETHSRFLYSPGLKDDLGANCRSIWNWKKVTLNVARQNGHANSEFLFSGTRCSCQEIVVELLDFKGSFARDFSLLWNEFF